MSERRWLHLAAALFLSIVGGVSGSGQAQESKPAPVPPAPTVRPAVFPVASDRAIVRIGTNLVAGMYYPTGGALCRVLVKAIDARCLVESTNGSTANIRGLLAGNLDFGIVQSDWQYHAVQGTASFRETGPITSLRSVMSLHAEPLTLVVRGDSGIETLEQIKGKRIGAGPADSGQRILFDAIIAALGWRLEDAGTVVDTASDAATQSFCAGELDAVFLLGKHPNAVVQRLLAACGGRLVPVVGPAIAKVMGERRYYAPTTIPAGIYAAGQPEIATLGVRATLVTLDTVPADLVYALVRTVSEHFDDFIAQHPGLASLKRSEITQFGLTAPMHEGALRYFREVGMIK